MRDYNAPRRTNDSQLARLRMERGLTQKQLAEKADCLYSDISRWEHNVCKPNATSLTKLAAALGCTIDEILKKE